LDLRRFLSGGARLESSPLAGPLGRRLLAWLLLLSLLPLLITNMSGYLASQEIIERLARRQLAAIAHAESQHVSDQLRRAKMDLQALAAGNVFLAAGAANIRGRPAGELAEAADRQAVDDYLARKRDQLPMFDALVLEDRDGALLTFQGQADPAFYRGESDSMPPPTLESAGPDREGRVHFRLTVPVRGQTGRPQAYLVGIVGPEAMENFLDIPRHLAGSIESFIVDRKGRILFVSHVHGDLDFSKPLPSPLVHEPYGAFAEYRSRDGDEVIGTSREVGDLQWRYVAELPVQDALGPLKRLRRESLYVAAGFTLLLLVTAWFVAGGIVAPVRELVAATRRLGEGDFETRVDVQSQDEIGELGQAFNEMAGQLEEALERVEALHEQEIERASQLATVGELASGVAHEIKNPVVGISNGLDLVRARLDDEGDVGPIMDEMKRQLERIEAAIRDLLAFARPAKPSLETVEGSSVVDRAARLVQPAAEQARVDLEFDVDEVEFLADEELVRQALVNLMMNAVQATPPGGRVTVSSRREGDRVLLRVADTGRGIPSESREDIFKPFFTTRHRGTGLGLPITRAIIERHGGTIEVESFVGEGTTFVVELPSKPDTLSTEDGSLRPEATRG